VILDPLGQFRDHGLVGELVDVVLVQDGRRVVVGGRSLAEDFLGQFVPARVIRFELVWRDGDLDILVVGLVDGLR
jgi:hypothetical protein